MDIPVNQVCLGLRQKVPVDRTVLLVDLEKMVGL